jgi:hypothetical protein
MAFTHDLDSANVDWDEIFEYQPGFVVELKSHPGVFDTIGQYETTMVPPIWLVNDPRPRYPHELRIVSRLKVNAFWLLRQYANRLRVRDSSNPVKV